MCLWAISNAFDTYFSNSLSERFHPLNFPSPVAPVLCYFKNLCQLPGEEWLSCPFWLQVESAIFFNWDIIHIKFTMLNCSPLAFSIFICVCNHHHCVIPWHSITLERNPVPISSQPHLLSPTPGSQPMAFLFLWMLTVSLTFLGHKHTFLWLTGHLHCLLASCVSALFLFCKSLFMDVRCHVLQVFPSLAIWLFSFDPKFLGLCRILSLDSKVQ